jgi:hypothetical protein
VRLCTSFGAHGWLAAVTGLAGLGRREGGWVGVEGRLLHFTSLSRALTVSQRAVDEKMSPGCHGVTRTGDLRGVSRQATPEAISLIRENVESKEFGP